MEDQQSIKTILSFGAKSVEPKILEQLLVGRDKNADYLFKTVQGIVDNGNNQQILVVGQRGMGKTHLLRVLYHRCQTFIEKNKLTIAYFSEEEYGVASYFDLLTRILYAFIRWYENDKLFLETKLEELQNTTSSEQTFFIEKIIKDYVSKKPLLILAENFGDILNSIGPQEQGKFRAWMYNNKRISIIATSQSISDDFDREDRPFYGFFNLYFLKPLSFKESLAFLISLAKLDDKPDVVKHLKTRGKAQVKAIHQLVKGNHRLLVTFYEFLKSDTLVKLSNHFIKTVNDLKPYYETYIRYLPPQQQKIIRYIALSRKPQQGTSISKNCFIDQKSLSKQLSELVRKNLLEVLSDQTDKRNKLYDINEPLLRISIEVGEHNEGITALFIDFLALYYNENELTTKKMKFTDLLEKCNDYSEKKVFHYEIQAIENALTLKEENYNSNNILENVLQDLIEIKGFKNRYSTLKKREHSLSKEEYNYCLFTISSLDKQHTNSLNILERISPDFIKKKKLYTIWGSHLYNLAKKERSKELYIQSIKKFETAKINNEIDEDLYTNWGIALIHLAEINNDESLFFNGIDIFNKAIESNDRNENSYIILASWQAALSFKNGDIMLAKKAIKNFEIALKLNTENSSLFIYWGVVIACSQNIYKKDYFKFELFKNKLSQLPLNNKIPVWKSFTNLSDLHFFYEMLPFLITDLQASTKQLEFVIIDWINNLLANNLNSLQKEDLKLFRKIILEFIIKIPELKITQIYIDTFEEYVLNNNKNAIYELPKEQRLFFQKYILGEMIEN